MVWSRSGDPSVSQNPREVCASHSPGQIIIVIIIACELFTPVLAGNLLLESES